MKLKTFRKLINNSYLFYESGTSLEDKIDIALLKIIMKYMRVSPIDRDLLYLFRLKYPESKVEKINRFYRIENVHIARLLKEEGGMVVKVFKKYHEDENGNDGLLIDSETSGNFYVYAQTNKREGLLKDKKLRNVAKRLIPYLTEHRVI